MKHRINSVYTRLRVAGAVSAVITSMVWTLSGCGAISGSRGSSADGTAASGRDTVVVPPQAYFDALLTDRMQMTANGALQAIQDQVMWVNFNGATIAKGFAKDQSFLPCINSVVIPPASISEADKDAILSQVALYFSNAGAKLYITADKPTSGDYTAIHVGGLSSLFGCPGSGNVAGMAPFDSGNANPNDVGFVFLTSKDAKSLAQAIAHEAGHTFGLDHSDNKADIMYASAMSVVNGFMKGIANISGLEQDASALLQKALGTGMASLSGIPVAATTAFSQIPSTVLPGTANLSKLGSLLTSLPQSVHSSSLNAFIPALSGGAIPAGVLPPNAQGALVLLTILQNATMGQNGGAMNMVQLALMVSGYSPASISMYLQLAGLVLNSGILTGHPVPVSIPGVTGSLPGQIPSTINVSQILGMANITNPSQLISMLPQYAQIIGATQQGPNAQALLSLVMMAVGQQYQTIYPAPATP